jgi:hypothetical protein
LKGRKGIYVPSFFRLKTREEGRMTFLLAKRETKKRWPTYKNIWALSLISFGRGKDSYTFKYGFEY